MRELARKTREFPAWRWIGFSEDDVALTLEGARSLGGKAAYVSQRVEDNAFHLAALS